MKEISTKPSFWQKLYNAFDVVLTPIEKLGHRYILAPFRWFLSQIDPFSYKIEGTLLKRILQVTIYPLFLALTFVIGFKLVENGITFKTFLSTILMFLVLGAIFAPLEHLIPFSRKWLDDKEMPTDVMLFFGGKYWGDFINKPIRLVTVALVVQQISPAIGKNIWPAYLHPYLQVFLLLSINDFFRYWYHRWMHENEFMWRWHAVHQHTRRSQSGLEAEVGVARRLQPPVRDLARATHHFGEADRSQDTHVRHAATRNGAREGSLVLGAPLRRRMQPHRVE